MSWIVGIIVGVLLMVGVTKILANKIPLKLYDWVLGAIAFLFFVLAAEHYYASTTIEHEIKAGWAGAMVLSTIAVLVILIDWQLIRRRLAKE